MPKVLKPFIFQACPDYSKLPSYLAKLYHFLSQSNTACKQLIDHPWVLAYFCRLMRLQNDDHKDLLINIVLLLLNSRYK